MVVTLGQSLRACELHMHREPRALWLCEVYNSSFILHSRTEEYDCPVVCPATFDQPIFGLENDAHIVLQVPGEWTSFQFQINVEDTISSCFFLALRSSWLPRFREARGSSRANAHWSAAVTEVVDFIGGNHHGEDGYTRGPTAFARALISGSPHTC